MPNPVTKSYQVDDATLIEASRTMRLAAIEDLAQLVAVDPAMVVAFTDDWKDANDAAEAVPSDEQQDDILTQHTEEVEAKMKECRDHFQDSKYFIELAFPGKQTIWNEFGFNDYDSVRASQDKMTGFMKRLNLTQEKRKVALLAVGYTQALIDKSETLRAELEALNAAQDLLKKSNVTVTQNRIELHNEVYNKYMTRVGKLGKRVFKDDFAKYQRYLLPLGSEPAEVISIKGKVTGLPGDIPLEDAEIKIEEIPGLEISTDADGVYQIGGLASGTYHIKAGHPDYEAKVAEITIVAGTPAELNFELTHV